MELGDLSVVGQQQRDLEVWATGVRERCRHNPLNELAFGSRLEAIYEL